MPSGCKRSAVGKRSLVAVLDYVLLLCSRRGPGWGDALGCHREIEVPAVVGLIEQREPQGNACAGWQVGRDVNDEGSEGGRRRR